MNELDNVVKTWEKDEASAFQNNPESKLFYEIKATFDPKVIGKKYPPIRYIDLSVAHAINFHNMPKDDLVFNEIELYKSSKITDIIYTMAISADGLLLSEKALNIFKNFNLGTYKVFKANVNHKDKSHNYGYLQIMNDLKEEVDYKRTTFYVTDMMDTPIADIDIHSLKEYEETGKKINAGKIQPFEQYSYLRSKAVIFKDNANLTDFFTLDSCGISLFISKELKDALINNGVTGAEIDATKKII